MQLITPIISLTRIVISALIVIVLSGAVQNSFAQEYTAKDSATFQRSLTESSSDFEKIDYQLKLAEYSIRKPGSFKADLDQARQLIDEAKKLNAKLKSPEAAGHILLEECFLSQESGLSSQGKQTCQKAIDLLKTRQNNYLLGRAYEAMASYYQQGVHGEWEQKIALTNQAVACYKLAGDRLKIAATLQYAADLYANLPDYPKALSDINESLSIYEAIHYPKTQGAYDLKGAIYFVQNNFAEGLKYELKAMNISDKLRDSSMQAGEIYNHVGNAFIKLDQRANAVSYLKTAERIAEKNNDVLASVIIAGNLANCYNILNKPDEALQALNRAKALYKGNQLQDRIDISINAIYLAVFTRLKNAAMARRYADTMINLSKSKGLLPHSLNDIYTSLIIYDLFTKDYKHGLMFLTLNKQVLDKWNVGTKKADNIRQWYKLDSIRGDYKSGFNHLLAYKALTDSIFNEKKSRQIGQLQVEHETQQKEDHIKLLTQQTVLDQTQLKSAQFTRNVTMAGIAVFILFAGIIYWRYREKQRINLLITQQNTELQKLIKEKEWLLKEVHHRVKNNLHTVICLLESQALYLENDALKAIEISRHRIYAMSLIHQKLYQSDDIKVVNMGTYLAEFITYLEESFGQPEHIKISLQAEPVLLSAGQAIPIGLIVNEAITNAYKYAFPDNKAGEINVALKMNQDQVLLSVKDNGVGFKQTHDKQVTSLGLELIKGLALDLRGELNLETQNGTTVEVSFNIDRVSMQDEEAEQLISGV